jgi:hypothetical protein
MGGQQPGLGLVAARATTDDGRAIIRQARPARPHAAVSEAELAAHEALLAVINKPVWLE